MTKKYADWIKIVIVLAGIYLLSQVTAIYLPIIVAAVFAFILNPLVDFITRLPLGPGTTRLSRGWASIIAIIVLAIIMSVVLMVIFTPFVTEFNRFVANLPGLVQRIRNLTDFIVQWRSELELPTNVLPLEQIFASASAYAVKLGQGVITTLMGFASYALALVVVPVLTYYMLKDWRLIRESCILALPPIAREKGEIIINDMALALSGYLHGQALISIIIGLLVFCGMYILGVDYPLVLGLLATITETIPIIGPIVGAMPAIFLAYLVSPALALKVIIFYLIVHQIENQIVVPKVMGTSIHLHPVTVIIGLLIGGQLAGIVGMILAVPLLALLKVLFKHLWHLPNEKGTPHDNYYG